MTGLRANFLNALRRLGARPRLLPLLAVFLGAPTVRPSLPFALRELLHRDDLIFYRVRENGRRVAIRHSRAAVVILGEVFNRHCYQPSADIEELLAQAPTILDLGGNIGLFGLFAASRWPEAQIVAFEPDPENAALHEMTIDANGLASRWQLVQAAASNSDGRISFVAGLNATSHVADGTSNEPTIEVPVQDVLPRIAQVDLLKMDIEGGEWAILGDPRFREAPPRTVVLEYHPEGCPGPNPRAAAEQALTAAGMRVQPTMDRDDGHGLLWAWRP
jgi:FkbM family methyltransferase